MKKALLLLPALFLFSGCGEVQFPESISTPTPVAAVSTPQAVNTPVTSPATSVELTAGENATLSSLTKERDNLSEAIKVTQDELRDCTIAKASLQENSNTKASSAANIEKYAPILKKYLTETPQKEYKFNLCGALGKATNQQWYASFVATLDAKKIPFSALNRPLKATDFGGVCASEEGKVALFLGASAKNKSEFHLVKYNTQTKVLEEAALLHGSCENCPIKFGKRFGPLITLLGESGGKTKEYKYYYDSNLITE